MKSFKEWYAEKHGLPIGVAGEFGEHASDVIFRLGNSIFEFADLVLPKLSAESGETFVKSINDAIDKLNNHDNG